MTVESIHAYRRPLESAVLIVADPSQAFRHLMDWMGPEDVSQQKLELVRRKLVFFFRKRGFGDDGDDLAHEVLTIVAAKCAQADLPKYDSPEQMIFGVAKMVAKRQLSKRMVEEKTTRVRVAIPRPEQADSNELRCLDLCCKRLDTEKLSLLLQYVDADEWDRTELSHRLGVTRGDLSVRVFRIKRRVLDCVESCVKKIESDFVN